LVSHFTLSIRFFSHFPHSVGVIPATLCLRRSIILAGNESIKVPPWPFCKTGKFEVKLIGRFQYS